MKIQNWLMIIAIAVIPMTTIAQPDQQPNEWRHGRGQFEGQRQGRKEMSMGQGRANWMVRLPDLTEQQKTDIKQVHTKVQQEMLPLRNQINEKEASLMTLQTSEAADMKAINKTIDEISVLKAKAQKTRASAHQDVRSILTDEQRLIFDTHFQMKADGNGRGKHRRPHQGR